jgi:transposase
MEMSSPRLPSAAEKPATLLVALELSKSTWLAAIHSPAGGKISQHRLAGGDATALLSLIERKCGEAQAALLRPVRVMSCYEAGYDGFWLHLLLGDHGSTTGSLTPRAFWSTGVFAGARRIAGCGGLVANVDGARARRAESVPRSARAERRARGRTPPFARTRAACQRARPAFEPHHDTNIFLQIELWLS